MPTYADVWVPHEQAANESCKREAHYAPACLQIRSSFSPRDTFAAFSKFIICGTFTPRKLPVLVVYWWWCVCVCVCACVCACVREQAYVRAHVSVCNSFYLFIVLGGLNTFLRTIAATSPRFRVRLVGCAGCGLAGSFSHGNSTDDELCCIATSEKIPRASLRPCTHAVKQQHSVALQTYPCKNGLCCSATN